MAAENILKLELSGLPSEVTANQAAAAPAPSPDAHMVLEDPNSQTGEYLPPESHVSEGANIVVTEVVATAAPAFSMKRLLVLMGVVMFVAFGVWLFLDDEDATFDPINAILSLVGLGEAEVTVAPVANTAPRRLIQAEEKVAKVPDNPYWELPNPPVIFKGEAPRQWSSEEESTWRDGLKHRFLFQRYKTVRDVRRYQLKGSEAVLWEGLNQKKFWLRMESLFAVAELGIPVGVDRVEKAIGEERSALVSNYFKRFLDTQTEGERHILRHALKLVDAKARYFLLQIVAQNRDPLRELYLVAATYDPGPGISEYAEMQLRRSRTDPKTIETFRNFILGVGTLPPQLVTLSQPPAPTETVVAQKVPTSDFVTKVEFFGDVKTEALDETGMVDDGSQSLEIIEVK